MTSSFYVLYDTIHEFTNQLLSQYSYCILSLLLNSHYDHHTVDVNVSSLFYSHYYRSVPFHSDTIRIVFPRYRIFITVSLFSLYTSMYRIIFSLLSPSYTSLYTL